MELKTFKNKRTATEFMMKHRCSYCDTVYVSVVIGIPETDKKICKGCLLKMISGIDNTITKIDYPK